MWELGTYERVCPTVNRGESGRREGGYPTTPPAYHRDSNSLSGSGGPPAPGWTSLRPGMLATSAAPTEAAVHNREAHIGELPWVADIPNIPELKGVTDDGKECAELLRLLG